MTSGLVCDRCGASLLVDDPVRYVARLEIVAAYDTLEIAPSDVARDRDLRAEIAALLEHIRGRDPTELEEEVHAVRVFDLCPPCRRALLADPLGRGSGSAHP